MASKAEFWLGVAGVGLLVLALMPDKTAKQPMPTQQKPTIPETPYKTYLEKIHKLWNEKNFSEAIFHALKLLYQVIRDKSGVSDKDSTELINTVFSAKKPVLRFEIKGHPKNVSDQHEGYFSILRGVSMAFRNPLAHANIEMSEKEAQLQFATIGYLIDRVMFHTVKIEEKALPSAETEA